MVLLKAVPDLFPQLVRTPLLDQTYLLAAMITLFLQFGKNSCPETDAATDVAGLCSCTRIHGCGEGVGRQLTAELRGTGGRKCLHQGEKFALFIYLCILI